MASLLFAACFFGAIACFIKKILPIGFFLVLCSIVTGLLEWVLIDAATKGNQQVVEYSFPASHYTFDKKITVTYNAVVVNGVELIEEERDTTYVLTGFEPIVNEGPNYQRKVLQ